MWRTKKRASPMDLPNNLSLPWKTWCLRCGSVPRNWLPRLGLRGRAGGFKCLTLCERCQLWHLGCIVSRRGFALSLPRAWLWDQLCHRFNLLPGCSAYPGPAV